MFAGSGGYQFQLRASHVATSGTVSIAGQSLSAPPGKTYLAVDVQLQNLTDRPEPLDPVVTSTSSALRLALPIAALSTFGLNPSDTQYTCLADRGPAGTCVLLSGTAVASVTPPDASSASVQVQPGVPGTKVVHLVSTMAVPDSAPLGQVTLYIETSATGALIQVPLAG